MYVVCMYEINTPILTLGWPFPRSMVATKAAVLIITFQVETSKEPIANRTLHSTVSNNTF